MSTQTPAILALTPTNPNDSSPDGRSPIRIMACQFVHSIARCWETGALPPISAIECRKALRAAAPYILWETVCSEYGVSELLNCALESIRAKDSAAAASVVGVLSNDNASFRVRDGISYVAKTIAYAMTRNYRNGCWFPNMPPLNRLEACTVAAAWISKTGIKAEAKEMYWCRDWVGSDPRLRQIKDLIDPRCSFTCWFPRPEDVDKDRTLQKLTGLSAPNSGCLVVQGVDEKRLLKFIVDVLIPWILPDD